MVILNSQPKYGKDCGKFEHDNEILNYKNCDDFINWLEPIVRHSINITGDLDKKYYIENDKNTI